MVTKEIINLSSDHADYFLNIFIVETKWRLLLLLLLWCRGFGITFDFFVIQITLF